MASEAWGDWSGSNLTALLRGRHQRRVDTAAGRPAVAAAAATGADGPPSLSVPAFATGDSAVVPSPSGRRQQHIPSECRHLIQRQQQHTHNLQPPPFEQQQQPRLQQQQQQGPAQDQVGPSELLQEVGDAPADASLFLRCHTTPARVMHRGGHLPPRAEAAAGVAVENAATGTERHAGAAASAETAAATAERAAASTERAAARRGGTLLEVGDWAAQQQQHTKTAAAWWGQWAPVARCPLQLATAAPRLPQREADAAAAAAVTKGRIPHEAAAGAAPEVAEPKPRRRERGGTASPRPSCGSNNSVQQGPAAATATPVGVARPRAAAAAAAAGAAAYPRRGGTGEGGGSSTKQQHVWERVLWKKPQRRSYADNYLDDSFLCGLVSNARIRSYSYCSLCSATVVITQHLSLLTIFTVVYVRFRRQEADGLSLVLLSLLLLLFGHALRWMLQPSWKVLANGVCSSLLGLGALRLAAPILRTLTESFSDDTVISLSIACFLLHIALADYSHVRRNPERIDESLTRALSINAALLANVVLASRLSSSTEVFGIFCFGIEMCALSPLTRRMLWQLHPKLFVYGVTPALILLTAALLLLEASWTLVVLYLFSMFFITFVGPYWLINSQVYKNEMRGPWDIAVVPTTS